MLSNEAFGSEMDLEKMNNSKISSTVSRAFISDQPEEVNNKTKVLNLDNNNSMWALHGGINYFPCEKSVNELPSYQYIFTDTENGIALTKKQINLDNLIRFPDSEFYDIMEEIQKFWNARDKFKEHGFLWKRGILLYGPPGSGKTSLIQIVANMVTERGGIAIYANAPKTVAQGLQLVRLIEPDRPIVVIMEDIDAMIRHYDESTILALLDGELQINNILFIATTNYPETLDRRIFIRPSRFDIVKKIGMPSAKSRKIYIKMEYPMIADDELVKWVKYTEEFSLAHLKEVIVSVTCLDMEFESVVERLKKMMICKPSSDEYLTATGNFGFGNKSHDKNIS